MLLESLVFELMRRHPLPWRIDYDWCVEVYDRNEGLVIKLMRDAEARELIDRAECLQTQSGKALEIEQMLADDLCDSKKEKMI